MATEDDDRISLLDDDTEQGKNLMNLTFNQSTVSHSVTDEGPSLLVIIRAIPYTRRAYGTAP